MVEKEKSEEVKTEEDGNEEVKIEKKYFAKITENYF